MKRITPSISFALVGASVLALTPLAQALTLSAGTFTDSSVLSLAGTSSDELYGGSISGSDETVGSYTFSYVSPGASAGNITFANDGQPGSTAFTGGYGGFLGNTTTGDASFDGVVGSGSYNGTSTLITLNGLTAGDSYTALILSDDDRTAANGNGGSDSYITDGSKSSDVLTDGYPNGTGTPSASDPSLDQFEGAYFLDTFTVGASQTSHSIIFTGAYVNGVLVESASTPEPSTCALMGLGLAALIWTLRRRSAQI